MTTMQGTRAKLRGVRANLQLMRRTMHDLSAIGGHDEWVHELACEASDLTVTVFLVEVPCLVCKQTKLAPVLVGDRERTEPSGCLCEECDARITKEVIDS